jgi:hypothetical protein
MLQKTPFQELQKTFKEEGGILQRLKKFDPEVSGLIFWPVMFGMAFGLGLFIVGR